MTIEELWQNLKPMVNKLEKKVDKLEPLIGKVDRLEIEVKGIKNQVTDIQSNVQEIKKDIHKIGEVNMTTLIKEQHATREVIKETKRNINKKLDKYLEKNEVEHKKFEYEIANLEWKNKIAN